MSTLQRHISLKNRSITEIFHIFIYQKLIKSHFGEKKTLNKPGFLVASHTYGYDWKLAFDRVGCVTFWGTSFICFLSNKN